MITIELVTGSKVNVSGENVHTNDLAWVALKLFGGEPMAPSSAGVPSFDTETGTVFINPDHVVQVYEAPDNAVRVVDLQAAV